MLETKKKTKNEIKPKMQMFITCTFMLVKPVLRNETNEHTHTNIEYNLCGTSYGSFTVLKSINH